MLFQGQEFMENGSFTHWRELDWERVETYDGIVQLYRDLIRLRRNQAGKTAGLTGGWFETIYLDEKEKLFAYRRWDKGGPGDDVVVLFNFANTAREAVQLKFPAPGDWQVRFNSDWKGYSEDFTEVPADPVWVEHDVAGVAVGPYSVIILSQD